MKEFWNSIQLVFTGIGGWLGYFVGGWDGLLYALIAFVVLVLNIPVAQASHVLIPQLLRHVRRELMKQQ